jgi:hypothetical protein
MQKIDGLNRPEGRLDRHGLAGHGGGYTETFPSNQEFGRAVRARTGREIS